MSCRQERLSLGVFHCLFKIRDMSETRYWRETDLIMDYLMNVDQEETLSDSLTDLEQCEGRKFRSDQACS